ncbi:MAG: DUF4124 domain-containing protein [Gammaproteobacteria bacterium]|nr:DUF4124 domain-containing protein [Gammaproteobacteria bacterium]
MTLCLLAPLGASAQQAVTYRWVDDEGVVHFGDRIPPEYAEKPKQVLNDQGIRSIISRARRRLKSASLNALPTRSDKSRNCSVARMWLCFRLMSTSTR